MCYLLRAQEEVQKLSPQITWLHYRQIKEQFNKDKQKGFMNLDSDWEKILNSENKLITKIYKKLLEWDTETEHVKTCMTHWARDIGRPILYEEWEKLWGKNMKFNYASDLRENQFKMIYRWYITPKKLGHYKKDKRTKCWKCQEKEGNFFHMWWACAKTKKYWTEIHKESRKILKKDLPFRPELYLLGVTNTNLGKNEEKILNYLVTGARIVFARIWRSNQVPTTDQWLVKISDIKNMDKLTFLMKKQQGNPIKEVDWSNFEEYIRQRMLDSEEKK
uniref:Reverse transcriptase zinc-binding domain-containing protein n=1 Tax=Anolis carolinensis TaxID=28377 RepID=A0A803TG30_ANOCA